MRISIDSRIFLTPASLTLSGVSSPRLFRSPHSQCRCIAPRLYEAHRTHIAQQSRACLAPNGSHAIPETRYGPTSRLLLFLCSSGLASSLASAAPQSLLPCASPEVVAPLFRVAWRGRDVDVQDRSPSLSFTGMNRRRGRSGVGCSFGFERRGWWVQGIWIAAHVLCFSLPRFHSEARHQLSTPCVLSFGDSPTLATRSVFRVWIAKHPGPSA